MRRATFTSALALAGLLTGCGENIGTSGGLSKLDTCPAGLTAIHDIQGTDWASALLGQTHSVSGVVTLAVGDGLYIESLNPDSNPNTSEGLFLETGDRQSQLVPAGTVVTARGQVAELGEVRDTKTALVNLDNLQACGDAQARPLSETELPLGGRDREAIENMRVSLGSASIVTDVYRLHEGVFRVARDHYLPQPTEVTRPGRDAKERAGRNWAYSIHVRLAPGSKDIFALGDELMSDEGVLGNEGRGPILLLDDKTRVLRRDLPRLAKPERGIQRIVSLNLQNYFNGDGRGSGFPTERGAETPREFERQREGFAATIELLKPTVVAVQEIENDGFGPNSAAQDFLALLEDTTGKRWAVAEPNNGDRIGTDEIAVGLFYRSDIFDAVGEAELLDAAPFDLLNRTPIAQVLQNKRNGKTLLVSVNHFKSKGGCPQQGRDQDQDDGQGCWNPTRLAAAKALAPWVKALAEERADGRGLVLGDLNAYRMEDPVQQLMIDGFADLTATGGTRHRYSYVFRGQSGTLDHAMATRALVGEVAAAHILNINAGFPRRLPLEPAWVGASDHDPVIVDVRFTQSFTSD